MNAIDVNVQDESVLRFIRSLPTDPDGTWLRVNGEVLFRVIPVSPADRAEKHPWTDEQNTRRCFLIDREVAGTISAAEAVELEELQAQLRRYRRLATPLPLAETRRLLEELERKAARTNP